MSGGGRPLRGFNDTFKSMAIAEPDANRAKRVLWQSLNFSFIPFKKLNRLPEPVFKAYFRLPSKLLPCFCYARPPYMGIVCRKGPECDFAFASCKLYYNVGKLQHIILIGIT